MVLQTFQKSSEKSNQLLSRCQIPMKYDWLSTFCILLWNNNRKNISSHPPLISQVKFPNWTEWHFCPRNGNRLRFTLQHHCDHRGGKEYNQWWKTTSSVYSAVKTVMLRWSWYYQNLFSFPPLVTALLAMHSRNGLVSLPTTKAQCSYETPDPRNTNNNCAFSDTGDRSFACLFA